jgi:hydroxymethylglutaryl-CoA lyase
MKVFSQTQNLLRQQQHLLGRQFPSAVKIVEVAPRDGLQNEKTHVPTDTKVELINRLSHTGLKVVEATSFVSPKAIPQLADGAEVLSKIERVPGVSYPVLVPNIKGFENAIKCGVEEIAVFGAASEGFTKKNINCTIKESLERFQAVMDAALQNKVRVRGYVSTVMGCPYDGEVDPTDVDYVAAKLFEMGCYEISLGDTIGIGYPS